MLILSAMLMLMMAQRSFDDKTGAFQEWVRVAKKWVASMLVVLQEHLLGEVHKTAIILLF